MICSSYPGEVCVLGFDLASQGNLPYIRVGHQPISTSNNLLKCCAFRHFVKSGSANAGTNKVNAKTFKR